jgi:hypothetical protein
VFVCLEETVMSQGWGLTTEDAPKPAARPVDPAVRRSGHKGIVWIHIAAIGIWLFTALILGVLWLAGKNVPGAIVLGGLLAAAGHGVFVAVHLFLSKRATRRSASTV